MADDNKDLVDDKAEAEAEAGFDAGFSNPTAPTETPKQEDEKKDDEEGAPDAEKPEGELKDPPDPKEEPPAPQPEYVQITKEQLARLEAAADKTAGFEAQLNKAFGSLGGMKQIVEQLQAKTPEGAAVEIPADAFEGMEEEFPDIAKHMRGVLEKTLKGVRGTADTKAVVDPEAVNKIVAEGIKQREMEVLEDNYPDWKIIVGAVDSADKADPNNEFRKWLGTQPKDYQTKINSTHSAAVLARAIDKFTDAKKAAPAPAPKPEPKPDPKVAARKARIEGAIPPKGDGNAPPPTKTDDDSFEEGFRSG